MNFPTLQQVADLAGVTVERVNEAGKRLAINKANAEDLRIMEHMMPQQKRPCGDCTMCCTAPAIEATQLTSDDPNDINFAPKPACEACQFANNGCSIYNDRPSICKHYMCLWSLGVIPASSYPMKRGVCWTLQPDQAHEGNTLLIGHAMDVDKVLEDPYSMEVIANYCERPGFAVTIRDRKKAVCFIGNGKGAAALIDPTDKMGMRILEKSEREFNYILK